MIASTECGDGMELALSCSAFFEGDGGGLGVTHSSMRKAKPMPRMVWMMRPGLMSSSLRRK